MRLHPKECATGAGGTVSQKICSGEITALFVRFKQRKPGETKAQKFRASISAVCLWIRQLHNYGGYAIIMGRTGGHWDETQYLKLLDEGILFESKHHLCHFGTQIDPNSDQPSRVCYRALTSQPIEWHPCCGSPY